MENNRRLSPVELVNWISSVLNERGFPPPRRLEAEHLVSRALNISRTEIYLKGGAPCSLSEGIRVKKMLEQRLERKPLSYVLGDCDFWSFNLKVGPGVLTPRKETEILVEHTLKIIPASSAKSYNILELGTGSAAIPLALVAERGDLTIFTVEKSEDSLRFALKNIALWRQKNAGNSSKIHLIHGDAFKAVKKNPIFDLIISNPPYIPKKEIKTLQEEVKDWEPTEALDGGEDGLDFFRLLKKDSQTLLKPGGFLIFEHGFNQKSLLQNIMSKAENLRYYDGVKDYSGLDRVLVYQKNDPKKDHESDVF